MGLLLACGRLLLGSLPAAGGRKITFEQQMLPEPPKSSPFLPSPRKPLQSAPSRAQVSGGEGLQTLVSTRWGVCHKTFFKTFHLGWPKKENTSAVCLQVLLHPPVHV